MQITQYSKTVIILILVLAVLSFILDDIICILAVFLLTLFLLSRYYIFYRKVGNIGGSVAIERILQKQYTRQGVSIPVETNVFFDKIPDGLNLEVTDLIPAGSVISGGANHINLKEGGNSGKYRYYIKSMAYGNISFDGIGITISDCFFRINLHKKSSSFRKPELYVYPANRFENTGNKGSGEDEINKITRTKGFEIRSFRNYEDGDDLRKIDWKMSAKFSKLYVREFMGISASSSLIVADLPEKNVGVNISAFMKLKESIITDLTSEIVDSEKARDFAVISGANMIKYLPVEKKASGIIPIIDYLVAEDQEFHLYRCDSHKLIRFNDKMKAATDQFTKDVIAIDTHFARGRETIVFESRIKRVLQSTSAENVKIFSMLHSDESHLIMLSRQAKQKNMGVNFYVPKELGENFARNKLSYCHFDSIEMI